MTETIFIDNILTYPNRIIDFIENTPVTEFVEIPSYIQLYLNNLSLSIYHCTRLVDKEFVLQNGLLIPSKSSILKDYYIETLEKHFKNTNYNFKDLIYNYNYEHRGNTIHFTTPYGTLNKRSSGSEHFFKFWGGELLEDILKPTLKNDYSELKKIGTPYIVRKEISFNLIDYPTKQRIIYLMLRFYKDKKLDGTDFTFYENINPTEIKEIIEASNVLENLILEEKNEGLL